MKRAFALWLVLTAADTAEACGPSGDACPVAGRSYNIALPAGEGPFPAVVFFHGSGGTGDLMLSGDYAGFVAAFTDRGYAFVAPTAGLLTYADGAATGWVWEDGADFAFASAVLDDLLARFPIDGGRILAAGHSHGAAFLWYLACAGAEPRFAAFAPHGGLPLARDGEICAAGAPSASILHAHGTADTAVPVGGTTGLAGIALVALRDLVEQSLAAARCGGGVRRRSGAFRMILWRGCADGLSLGYALHPGGHATPPDWPRLILDWFETLKRR